MQHSPVLLTEVLSQLAIKPNGVYIDATFGRGGHSQAILAQLGPHGYLLAMDRDLAAINSDAAKAMAQNKHFKLVHQSFANLATVSQQENLLADGILLDLGVSSPQLDTPARGFSFLHDGPLDMRMDTSQGMSAQQWLQHVTEAELVRVLFEYGEERYAKRIAKAIVINRAKAPITTTHQLASLVADNMPVKEKHKHPATRVFQAIRIAVNQELDQLQQALQQSLSILKPGGRLVVITFHSLEDRIVKQFIHAEAGAKFDPGRLPIKQTEITQGVLKKLGKPIRPSQEEITTNPRARSATLRVAEKR
jgi:16S rRNA (cytosine1402-N4)-methyltransferase